MALSDQVAWQTTTAAPEQLDIRPALMEDLEAMMDLHVVAFNDKFRATFGARHIERGRAAMVRAHQIQGLQSLAGMYVARIDGQIVGTITLRTWDMHIDDPMATERAFYQTLGFWRTLRALYTMVRLDHSIGPDEGYITDVAVHHDYRRRGIAKAMLDYIVVKARNKGKRYLGLYVSASNTSAYQLYLRAGFLEAHVRRSRWNGLVLGESRWIYMRKALT